MLLAPGASGDPERIRPFVDGLAARGVAARAVALPRGRAERAVPAFAAELPGRPVVAGGHSFGGRVASLLATERALLGLVLLSYPLHRPGRLDEPRTAHWSRVDCPVLLLSGGSDPFARADLLRRSVDLLADAELVVYPGLGHSLAPVVDDALERVVAFCRRLGL